MKNWFYISFLFLLIIACSSIKKDTAVESSSKTSKSLNDTIRIANDSLQYEVIIIDPRFNTWLNFNALPRNFHSLSFLENKNQIYINEWNNRAMQPQRFNPNLYEMRIDYDPNIKYGYEVNYLIYNYMIYFQNTFKQKLGGYVPIR